MRSSPCRARLIAARCSARSSTRRSSAITGTADGQGYWLLAKDGGVFAFNAPFYGSTGNLKLNKPVVGLAVRPQGDGYWFVAADGGIFSFGAAPFFGSTGDRKVAGASRLDGTDAERAAATTCVGVDGSVYPFGDATRLRGSEGSPSPIVGMAVRPQGDGYWLAAADGTVTGFGAAASIGAPRPAGAPAAAAVVGISATASGGGYRLVRCRRLDRRRGRRASSQVYRLLRAAPRVVRLTRSLT